jgi:hypothetical protein
MYIQRRDVPRLIRSLHWEPQNGLCFKVSALSFLYICIKTRLSVGNFTICPKLFGGEGTALLSDTNVATPLCVNSLITGGYYWPLCYPYGILPVKSSSSFHLPGYSRVSSQSVAGPHLQRKGTISPMKTQSVALKSRHQVTCEREQLIFTHVILLTIFISSPIDV